MTTSRKPVAEEITAAFLELMAEKPFIDITVSDVVRRAGVARASFYRNFSSTQDILDSFLENLFQQFSQVALPVLSSQNKRDWRAFLFRFIYFADEYQGKIILSEKSNISLLLLKMADFAHDISNSVPYNNIREKYSISSRLSVIHSTISRWLDDGQKETPEELVDYLMGFILTI